MSLRASFVSRTPRPDCIADFPYLYLDPSEEEAAMPCVLPRRSVPIMPFVRPRHRQDRPFMYLHPIFERRIAQSIRKVHRDVPMTPIAYPNAAWVSEMTPL